MSRLFHSLGRNNRSRLIAPRAANKSPMRDCPCYKIANKEWGAIARTTEGVLAL